jgi:K+-sensing histidine kinase KdpD
VLGDERLLRKCIDELVDNAIKFSPEGGSIDITAEAVAATGRRRGAGAVRMTVRDQGIGIEPSQMGRLFQDFRQLDGSETRTFGGLGLGLSYARRVALAHHGDITAASTPGRGSGFTLVLPAAEPLKAAVAKPRTAKPPARPKPKVAAGRPVRIRRTRPISAKRTPAGRKKVAAAKASRKRKGRR